MTDWRKWIEEVEGLLGHDADGFSGEHGYSLDEFTDMFNNDLNPLDASRRIVGALYVLPDGKSYRYIGGHSGPERGVFEVQNRDGVVAFELALPDNAVQVWRPRPLGQA
ncbi:MAG: hypothetical protein ACRCYU_23495 [Nocardioides sp.]